MREESAHYKFIRNGSSKGREVYDRILCGSVQYPTLVCPKYHTAIILVSEDEVDIMNSKLLSSRSLCTDHKPLYSQKHDSLKVIEDFLKYHSFRHNIERLFNLRRSL
jgi:hypothetical protein